MLLAPLFLGLGGMTGVLAWARRSLYTYKPANGAALPQQGSYVPAPAPQSPQQTHQEVQQVLLEPTLMVKLIKWLDAHLSAEQSVQMGRLVVQSTMARLGRYVAPGSQTELEDFCTPLGIVLNGEQIDALDQDLPGMREMLARCARNKPVIAPPPAPAPVIGPVGPAPSPVIPAPGPVVGPVVPAPLPPLPGPVLPPVPSPVIPAPGPIVGPVVPKPPTPYVPPVPPTPAPYIPPVPADPMAGLVRVTTEDLTDILNRQRGRNWPELKATQPDIGAKLPAAYQAATLGLQLSVAGAQPVAPQGVDRRILPMQAPGGTRIDWFVAPSTVAALKANTQQPAPLPAPVPAPQTAKERLLVGATALRTFLLKNPTPAAFGYKDHPSQPVRDFQALAAQGGFPAIKQDGILGTETRKAAASVNITFPERPTAQAAKPTATPAAVIQPAPVPAPVVVTPPSSAPGFNPAQASKLAPTVAANIASKQFNYDRKGLAAFQTAAGIKADGIYGGASMGALRFYLGKTPPKALFQPTAEQPYTPPGAVVQPPPLGGDPRSVAPQPVIAPPPVVAPPPVIAPSPMPAAVLQPAVIAPPSTPLQFAQVLRAYLLANPTPAAFGIKGKPSEPVRDFQRSVGIAQDGILGNDVRREGTKLGVTFPPRPTTTATSGFEGYNPELARQLARAVVRNIRSHGRGYDRRLCARFQQAAGVPVTGEYDGRTKGALQHFGSQRAPRALVGPQRAIPFRM